MKKTKKPSRAAIIKALADLAILWERRPPNDESRFGAAFIGAKQDEQQTHDSTSANHFQDAGGEL